MDLDYLDISSDSILNASTDSMYGSQASVGDNQGIHVAGNAIMPDQGVPQETVLAGNFHSVLVDNK